MLWTAIGCLIGGIVLLGVYFVWDSVSSRDEERRRRFARWRPAVQVGYLVLFMAAAVLFLIW